MLARKGAQALVKVMDNYSHYRQSAYPQVFAPGLDYPRAPKLTHDMARVDWSRMDAAQIYRRHLAFSHQVCYCSVVFDYWISIR
jgi:methionyl-tRNA formyltransferase